MTIDPEAARAFLELRRLAVVGASDDERKFGNAVYRKLLELGYEVAAVNPAHETVAGDPAFTSVADVPGGVEGAIIMTSPASAADAVRSCLDAGVDHVWFFQGLGAPGNATDEARRLCEERGVATVAGACPFMFLEPVGGMHRLHRSIRRLRGALAA